MQFTISNSITQGSRTLAGSEIHDAFYGRSFSLLSPLLLDLTPVNIIHFTP
jgi:hypothetical protein